MMNTTLYQLNTLTSLSRPLRLDYIINSNSI